MGIVGWPDEVESMEEGDPLQYIYQSPVGTWWVKDQVVADKGIRKVGEMEGNSEGPFDTFSEAEEVAESRTNEHGPVFSRD